MAAKLHLGDCRATPGAMEALAAGGGDWRMNAAPHLARHQDGEWGELDDHDQRVNESALQTGARLFSAYTVCADFPNEVGRKVWIITEAGRTLMTATTASIATLLQLGRTRRTVTTVR